ncbi:PREDICTED: neutrophil gelatinase-associated lipocalin-like, partial [Chinchilla lanigera]|uniref:neutrophil gelatinase-associated lipocalin-like n=1 Tax=Chinchilla lanigera TaxID=34839 RepID=UPI0006988965
MIAGINSSYHHLLAVNVWSCTEVMALGLLYLGLTLLGILQTQAQDAPPALPLNPLLSSVPLQPDFQEEQFQGKWYVIAVADNSVRFENVTQLDMYSMKLQLSDDHSYNVTYTGFSEEYCQLWSTGFVPTVLPGQFTLENVTSFSGIQSHVVRVVSTDYNQFATIFTKIMYKSRVYFESTLLGRAKELSSEVKESYLEFSKSLGLSEEDIVFTYPI